MPPEGPLSNLTCAGNVRAGLGTHVRGVADSNEHRAVRRRSLRANRSPIVLVAAESPSLRRPLAIALWRCGFCVLTALDGAELDSWIRRLISRAGVSPCVDLIIADQRMSSATGLESLARLRSADWSTRFILIATPGDVETHTEAARLGASCVLDKPVDLDAIRAAVLQHAVPHNLECS